ncbi:MAG TPA: lytic transglycosylase domain-containing protein [Vicinamibacterales bacterium]|nr:lytic transglycosylase domain-containing protein [Vicinamibacterales bacterium]
MNSLPGLSRQYNALIRAETGTSSAAKAAEFQRLAESVIGSSLGEGVDWTTPSALPCDTNVRRRDHVAWQMAMVGHSAKEISDVLRGHLTVADLDGAQARLMAGFTRTQVAEFLESRWREPIASPPASGPEPLPTTALASDINTELELLAKKYQVPSNLIRAMVAAESGGNARAISRAGAIGLMQLMPATAAALGVDPWHPLENLRGGIQYFAELLRAYDQDPRLALIAYNAGPQHANRVRAGTAVAYRETRKYLDIISATYPLP